MNEHALQRLDSLNASLERLGEALSISQDQPLAVDGTIQRFEFTFELFWKSLQRLLAPIRVSRPTVRNRFSSTPTGLAGSGTRRLG